LRGKYTKEEVLGVVFSKLKPNKDQTFADIGCGSGIVAEFFSPFVKKVFAVDLRLTDEAKSRLEGIENVELLEMDGGEFLNKFNPDLVFFGGTKGIEDMLEVCGAERIVVNAARIEVALMAARKMKEIGIFKEIVIVNIAKSYELAGGLAFHSLNPVFVVFGSREFLTSSE